MQVKTNFRTAITVPEKSWSRFRDIFADYCDKMKEGAGASGMTEINKGTVGSGAQASSPSSTSQQPNPNTNLDSNLIK